MNSFDDVTLVVEGHNIVCSRAILAQHSEYFKIMFEGNFCERDQSTITMNDVDYESLRICIRMLENNLTLERENLPMVLETACMLQFEELTEIIGQRLIDDLNVDNCLDVWLLTEPMNLKPVYLKAKRMAMVEFDTIKDRDALLKLDKEELHKYLANEHLVCKEFDVFRTFIKWSLVNGNNMIMELVAHLDFNRLTDNEIKEIMLYRIVRNSSELYKILKSVILIRKRRYAENYLAHKLVSCNRRGCWTDPLFFEAVEKRKKVNDGPGVDCCNCPYCKAMTLSKQKEVADDDGQDVWGCYCVSCQRKSSLTADKKDKEDDDGQGVWEALILWMRKEHFFRNVEYKLVINKQQYRLLSCMKQHGPSYYKIWTFDRVRKDWNKNTTLTINHEVYDLCLNKNAFYIVGGINSESNDPPINRVLNVTKKDDLRYDVFLPKDGANVKCCNYNDELFLFYNELKRAYLCDPDYKTFIELKIVDEQHFPRMEGEFAIYYCNDRIFLKDKKRLVQLRVESNKLSVVKVSALSQEAYEVRDKSLLCHETVYSMRRNDNLLTVQGEMICRGQQGGDDYRVGTTRYVFDTDRKMLLPDDHKLSKTDKYVNTIKNIFDD